MGTAMPRSPAAQAGSATAGWRRGGQPAAPSQLTWANSAVPIPQLGALSKHGPGAGGPGLLVPVVAGTGDEGASAGVPAGAHKRLAR